MNSLSQNQYKQMTNKKNRNKHHHNQHHNQQQYAPRVEINEEDLLKQCLSLHQLLKDRTAKLRKLETGDMCFVLSSKWLRDWKDFVGYDGTVMEGEKIDKKYYGKRHPGKINSDIIASSVQSKNFYALPKEMNDYEYLGQVINEKKNKDDDFIAVTEDIWFTFLQYYEGEEIRRPVRKTKGSVYYDGQPLRCETIFVNLERDDLQEQIKKTAKRFYETFFPSQKMQLSTLWTFKDLMLFYKEYCRHIYGHDNIRIWKGHSYLGTYTLVTSIVESIKQKKYLVRGKLMREQKYGDLDIDDFIKNTHTLIVQIGEALKEESVEGQLKGYCQQCINKKPLIISCVCHQVDYCHERCRIDDQNFHFKSCTQAFDSEDDQQFELKYSQQIPKIGLDNLGNTCYMNSVLQSILSIDHLRQFFSSNQYLKHLNQKQQKENNCLLLRKFSKTIKYLLEEPKSISPWALKGQINYNLGAFRGYNQHDANDFLVNFLNCLNDYLSKQGDKAYNKILQPFIGEFHSIVICPHCNIKSQNNQIFMQVSVPIKSKVKTQFYYYCVVDSAQESIKGKANLCETWGEMKKSVGVPPQTLVFMAKDPDGLVLINEEERSPEKVVKILKGAELVYVKNIAKIQGHNFFVASLVTNKQISGYKMKSPYGHYNIFSIYDIEVTLGTLCLKLIQTFFAHKPDVVAEATKMEQEYFAQITSAIQAENEEASKSKMKQETKEGQQEQKQSEACKKIVEHFNSALKKFKEELGIEVYINHFKRYKNTCAFCKKKCQNCELPIIFDKGFENFFAQRYNEVKFEVHLKEQLSIKSETVDLASSGDPTIHDCLSLFNQPEQLDEQNAWYCQNCDNMALASKQMWIKQYPPILILHLNRFKTVDDKRVKNNESIFYNEFETFGTHKYRLLSVIVHEGSIDAGHYWSISYRDKSYYIFNDAKAVTTQKIHNKNAYILVYCDIDFIF